MVSNMNLPYIFTSCHLASAGESIANRNLPTVYFEVFTRLRPVKELVLV